MFVAVLPPSGLEPVLIVAVAYVIIQTVEGNVLVPVS